MVSKKGQRSRQACEVDLWLIINSLQSLYLEPAVRLDDLDL